MKFPLLILALGIALSAGCSQPAPRYTRLQVHSETYEKFGDLQNSSDLARAETLFNDREPHPIPEIDLPYVLDIVTDKGTTYWWYHPDGTVLHVKVGTPLAAYKLRNPKPFNRLIKIPEQVTNSL